MSDDNEEISLLVVSIDGHQFALPTANVQRVVRAVAVTPLPNAPSAVYGVINVQGELLPVLSGRACLGLPEYQIEPEWCYVVLQSVGGSFALVVDSIIGVFQVSIEDFSFNENELITILHTQRPGFLSAPPPQGLSERTKKLPVAAKIGGVITFLCYPDNLVRLAQADAPALAEMFLPHAALSDVATIDALTDDAPTDALEAELSM
jgi:chemotaxis signal transduction protein